MDIKPSMISVDLRDRRLIYEQIVDSVKALVLSGEANQGDSLPSVRLLARELGLNPNTVQKAYNELERLGVLAAYQGRGSIIVMPREALFAERLTAIGDILGECAVSAAAIGVSGERFIALCREAWEKAASEGLTDAEERIGNQ